MIRLTAGVVVALVLAFFPISCRQARIKVGSKKFTESVILGEMINLLAEDSGVTTVHFRELGGTRLAFEALLHGDIDIYPEYTGTIREEIFSGESLQTDEQLAGALSRRGIRMSRPLGFNNTYAIGMLQSRAEQLKVKTISDLSRYPDLRFGFSNEFLDRDDGWRNLKQHYGLPQTRATGLDHDLAYRQLRSGTFDAIDVYTTDAKIDLLDLQLLADDRDYFPRYDCVLLYREDLALRHPSAIESILRIEGCIGEKEMIQANGRSELDRIPEPSIAAEYLREKLGVSIEVHEETVIERICRRTIEHVDLVRKSLIPAILIGIPLGICAAKYRRLGHLILGGVGMIQTIPALALLVLLLAPMAQLQLTGVGIGSVTAVLALFLYSLLPIVRNTATGLNDIANEYNESSLSLGLPVSYRIGKIELPLASRSILAGVKTAAVMNVGFATLGALIGAGGYGQPILTGIRLADEGLIMQGAIPAAAFALAAQGFFELAERYVVPRGLRLRTAAA